MDRPDHPETRLHYDSDWTPMYIILALIPLVFLIVALFSKRRDHVLKKEHDLETAKYNRARFPWKDAVNVSENMNSAVHPSASTSSPRSPAGPVSYNYGESNRGLRSEGPKKVPPSIQVPQINVIPSQEVNTGKSSTFAQVGMKEPHAYWYGNDSHSPSGGSRYTGQNYQVVSV
ncbi:hypothetical protein F4775DRAFT_557157 [Biscogniauxia sp. FL1348]|nr:hypothetical protein F4775DRAFT_557157 [Biscogniauxia sp. FL1348]